METVDPGEVGLDAGQLVRVREHLERRYLTPRKITGCTTVVARGCEVGWFDCLGKSDLERGRETAPDTLYRIYSMTKPITSIALMQLYEQGHFQLDDDVTRFLPEWRELSVYRSGTYPDFETTPLERPLTIKDLLSHTSGLTYDFMESTPVDHAYRRLGVGRRRDKPTQHLIEQLAQLPLEFQPGTRWNYSVATDVCGALVERISGERFDQYLERRVFEPLGMNDTNFFVATDDIQRFAANYERDSDKQLVMLEDPELSPYLEEPALHSGGGGLISTAADYTRFCMALANGGRLGDQRLIGRKTLELMTTNHLPGGSDLAPLATGQFSETTYDGVGFGLGLAMVVDVARTQAIGSRGEYFWGGMASTIFWVDPSEELSVVFMTQFMPSGTFNFRGQLKSLIYPALL